MKESHKSNIKLKVKNFPIQRVLLLLLIRKYFFINRYSYQGIDTFK